MATFVPQNINTHDAINKMLGALEKLDMQVQQQLLHVLKIECDSIALMSSLVFIIFFIIFCFFTYIGIILQLSGNLLWELAPYNFMLVFLYIIPIIFLHL